MVATRRDQRCTEHSGHIDYPAASAALAACWIASAVLKAGGRVGRLLARPAMRRFDLGEGKGRGGEGNPRMGEGNQSGRLLLWGCQMRKLGGERGKNGFELEVGDGHGENPSFPIPSPSFGIAWLNSFFFFPRTLSHGR